MKSVKKEERQISVERVVGLQESQKPRLCTVSSFSPRCPSSPARAPWRGSPGTLGSQTLPSSSCPGTAARLSVAERAEGREIGCKIEGF